MEEKRLWYVHLSGEMEYKNALFPLFVVKNRFSPLPSYNKFSSSCLCKLKKNTSFVFSLFIPFCPTRLYRLIDWFIPLQLFVYTLTNWNGSVFPQNQYGFKVLTTFDNVAHQYSLYCYSDTDILYRRLNLQLP